MPGITSNTPVKILIMFILLKNGEFLQQKIKVGFWRGLFFGTIAFAFSVVML